MFASIKYCPTPRRVWRSRISESRLSGPYQARAIPGTGSRCAAQEEDVMPIGFNVPTTGPLIEPDSLVRIVTEGEALGFDYVTISDHIMVPRNLQSKYPYTGTGEFPGGRFGRVARAADDRGLCRRADEEASLRPFG